MYKQIKSKTNFKNLIITKSDKGVVIVNNKFKEKIFLGEITNIHGNASEHFYPPSDEKLCSKIIFG